MMDLEQRVQALEQELEILKNQIQSVLLDLQEQVLANTYPGLRAGESAPAYNPPPSPPPAKPEPDVYARQDTPVRKMSANPAYDMPDDRMPSNHMEPQGYANDMRQEYRPEYRDDLRQDYPQDRRQEHRRDWHKMSELEEWAIHKIESIGVQDTADLIRAYTVKGHMTPEERDELMDFVALHVANYPDAPTQPSRPASFDNAVRVRQDARTTKAAIPAEEIELLAATAKPVKTIHAEPEASKPGKPSRNTKKRTTKPDPIADDKDGQSVVLRLIAGVQNAGAGVRWRKDQDG